MNAHGSLREALPEWIETCRDLGHRAFREEIVRDGTSQSVEIEDVLDIFDRHLDHILGRVLSVREIDHGVREWAYQKALGYKEKKLNRMRVYVSRLENGLTRQKAQTADDQRYIDLLEAAVDPVALGEIRATAKAFRRGNRAQ